MRARFALRLVEKMLAQIRGEESASWNPIMLALLTWMGVGVPLFLAYRARQRQRNSTKRKG